MPEPAPGDEGGFSERGGVGAWLRGSGVRILCGRAMRKGKGQMDLGAREGSLLEVVSARR